MDKIYAVIDLKSFYASVECVERGLDPLTTNLVVADKSRTEKTICLAVSPSLKKYGIPGRPRLFEVIQKVKRINKERQETAPGHKFIGQSFHSDKLSDPSVALAYITAPPRMSLYMKYSTQIYQIYLRYFAPEDIHVYSIDEVFMDVTHYLKTYGMTAYQLAQTIILDVQDHIGITATAGIGTNLYLCKIAMDIVAKHIDADENGVRIAQLDEKSYRKLLWDYRPITDFWRVGPGYAKKLAENGMYTMGDVARCSIGKETDYYNEDLLYKLFGVNAELLIDHAWGYEPCTIAQIKAYRPQANSSGSGQVLQCPYPADKARIVVQEMTDQLVLDLVEHGFVTDQIVLTVGYDIENLTDPVRAKRYHGEVTTDRYGRKIPKHAHGTANLQNHTSSAITVVEKTLELYDRIINPDLLIRRIYVTACHVRTEQEVQKEQTYEQMSLFDFAEETEEQKAQKQALQKEKQMQKAMLSIKQRYGKNAILKGTNFKEGATMRQRNGQIGGHRA